jgi:NADH-quinone oxidoreductase subunit H
MRWSFFFMAEYGAMFLVSGVAAILFLGAWNTGIGPVDELLGSLGWLGQLVGMFIFILKASFLVFVQIWVRWTFPRIRIDQVMTTCLKYLIPMSCTLFLGAVFWPLVLAMMTAGENQRTHLWGEPLGERVSVQADQWGSDR